MKAEIKRRTETYICEQLRAAIPLQTFIPMTGGDAENDAFDLEPPFTVITISEANKMFDQESTWSCKGTCQVVSHQAETRSPDHSRMVEQIYNTLSQIQPYQLGTEFFFHGISIEDSKHTSDDAAQAHADIFTFACGVGG